MSEMPSVPSVHSPSTVDVEIPDKVLNVIVLAAIGVGIGLIVYSYVKSERDAKRTAAEINDLYGVFSAKLDGLSRSRNAASGSSGQHWDSKQQRDNTGGFASTVDTAAQDSVTEETVTE